MYRDAFELALVAIAFLLYFVVRGSVVDRYDEALRHANDVIDIERRLGIFWEPRLQEMVLDESSSSTCSTSSISGWTFR